VAATPPPDPLLALPVLPPVQENALLWKERFTGGRSLLQTPGFLILVGPFVICGLMAFLAILLGGLDTARSFAHAVNIFVSLTAPPLKVLYGFCLACCAVGVAFRAAACVVRERQAHTLDMLLMLPVERGEILRAKFLGALLKGWPWLALLGTDI